MWAAPSFAATAVAPAPAPVEPAADTTLAAEPFQREYDKVIPLEYCQTVWRVDGHCDLTMGQKNRSHPTGEYYSCSSNAEEGPVTKSALCTIAAYPLQKINNSRAQADNFCATKRPANVKDTSAIKKHLNAIECSYKASTDEPGISGTAGQGSYQCVPARSEQDPSWNGSKCARVRDPSDLPH